MQYNRKTFANKRKTLANDRKPFTKKNSHVFRVTKFANKLDTFIQIRPLRKTISKNNFFLLFNKTDISKYFFIKKFWYVNQNYTVQSFRIYMYMYIKSHVIKLQICIQLFISCKTYGYLPLKGGKRFFPGFSRLWIR